MARQPENPRLVRNHNSDRSSSSNVFDRFIPLNYSPQTYRRDKSEEPSSPPPITDNKPEPLAEILGMQHTSRVLQFSSSPPRKEAKLNQWSAFSEAQDAIKTKLEKQDIKHHLPYRQLDAPSLANDFYSNLVSWSKQNDTIAVGLGMSTFFWSQSSGARELQSMNELISCVSFSYSDLLAVGTKRGTIILYRQDEPEILNVADRRCEAGACSIVWTTNSRHFYLGDESGNVMLFGVSQDFKVSLINHFQSQQQQVCGLALNSDQTKLVVGGNDNCCKLWDVSDMNHPQLMLVLPHKAAVKALAFCPWFPTLLVTGGGSKDRCIRFWHSTTGTLLTSHDTKAQITSLTWSPSSKQLLATFGFGQGENYHLMLLYSYPEMKVLMSVGSKPNVRVLSSAVSKDGGSICLAINNSLLQFYSIWDSRHSLKSLESGLMGSEIIDISEGVHTHDEIIR